jgi:hypothetical protein
MRKLTTAGLLAGAALLMLADGPVAMAQTSSKSGSGTSQTTGGPPQAPVGHRQPRAGDVPSEKNGTNKLDAEDAALDRKIKSICRGC